MAGRPSPSLHGIKTRPRGRGRDVLTKPRGTHRPRSPSRMRLLHLPSAPATPGRRRKSLRRLCWGAPLTPPQPINLQQHPRGYRPYGDGLNDSVEVKIVGGKCVHEPPLPPIASTPRPTVLGRQARGGSGAAGLPPRRRARDCRERWTPDGTASRVGLCHVRPPFARGRVGGCSAGSPPRYSSFVSRVHRLPKDSRDAVDQDGVLRAARQSRLAAQPQALREEMRGRLTALRARVGVPG